MASRGRILIVDDSDINRSTLERLLGGQGYEALAVPSGPVALEQLSRQSFDLILLDVMMQGLSGFEVLREVRTRLSTTELPVIMTTARDGTEDIVHALELGANDYVTKPLDLPVLLARIQTQLSLKDAVAQISGLERKLAERNRDLEAANSQLSMKNERMKQDLEGAARIQSACLPPGELKLPALKVASLYKPCAELAGDSFNVFQFNASLIGMYVLDVSGHGLPAALLAVTLGHMLSPVLTPGSIVMRAAVESGDYAVVSPAEVANILNGRFAFGPATGQYFTLVYGILNSNTGEFRYVAAGHPGPVHLKGGKQACCLDRPAMPIGIGDGRYEERQIRLDLGDSLFLYSDGVCDAMNANHEGFGKDRMKRALESGCSTGPRECVLALWRELEQWTKDCPIKDDVTMLAMEFRGKSQPAAKTQPARKKQSRQATSR
jgi:sigma-B regulation protein RsbU (phosphoserine phosphatase)